jgi:hypothetical protein
VFPTQTLAIGTSFFDTLTNLSLDPASRTVDAAYANANPGSVFNLLPRPNITAWCAPNPAVALNPFGQQSSNGPYYVDVLDSSLTLTQAPKDITVTLLRQVISQCSGLLFSSNRTVVVSQGQAVASFNFNAGRDPACNTLPITTEYTVTGATMSGQTLDLSIVPAQQLTLTVTR